LHRAVLGSLERFLGILIESTAGHLPLWLAPRPVAVCTITNSADEYATTVQQKLVAAGIPAELDIRNEKIGFKVREHSRAKTPRIWVIGEQEAQHNQVAIRTLGSQATETVDLDEAVAALAEATRLPI
jgi:threonyl-tRNA synthetase